MISVFTSDTIKCALDPPAPNELTESLQTQINASPEYKKTLWQLAHFYGNGYALDWDSLHANETRNVLSLPGYPFIKTRYWLNTQFRTMAMDHHILSIEELLKAEIAALLKMPVTQITNNIILSDLGFDSISFQELAARIASRFKVDFAATLFFNYSNVQAIAENNIICNLRYWHLK